MPTLRFLLLLTLLAPLLSRGSDSPPVAQLLPTARAELPVIPEQLVRLGDQWLATHEGRAWTRPLGGAAWTSHAVPSGFALAAHASGIADGNAWLVIGGRAQRTVQRVALENNTITLTALPELPEARADAGVALLGRTLYVIGGTDAAARPVATVFALDLDAARAAWIRLADFPGGPVTTPGITTHYHEILVTGGRDAAGQPRRDTWSFLARPVDGTTFTGWRARAPAPFAFASAAVVPSGTAHSFVFAPGRAEFAVFNAILDAWFVSPAEPIPSVGLVATGPVGNAVTLARDGTQEFSLAVAKPSYRLAWLDYATLAAYFALMVAVGVWLSGKQETSAQFALGNRDVKWWAAGISMFATGASSISFMAIPALAFATNLVWFLPVLMVIVGYFVSGYIIYPLVRKLEITSTYEYLDRRFNRSLRLLASAQCIIFQTFGRMSVIMVLPSLAISALTGLDVMTSVLLMGVLTTIYTAIGGFNAVIWTDVFQGILMLAAPLLVIGYAIAGTEGGFAGNLAAAQSYEKLRLMVVSTDLSLPVVWILLLGSFLAFVSVVGDQPIVQRIFSVPLPEVRRTALMSAICGLVIGIMTYGMGTAMFGFFHSQPEKLSPALTNDQIVPLFIVQNLPAGVCGVMIASIFAAAMSTLSSSMNSVATLICEDFYKPLFPQSSDRTRMRLMRWASYGVGAVGTGVAIMMAQMETTSMFATWNRIIGLLGGGFVGIYMLGIFTTRTNSAGAIAGGVSSVVVMLVIDHVGGLHWMAYMPVATVTCLVIGYVVSLLTGGSRKDLVGLTAFTTRAPLPKV
jgi:SSS family transporter